MNIWNQELTLLLNKCGISIWSGVLGKWSSCPHALIFALHFHNLLSAERLWTHARWRLFVLVRLLDCVLCVNLTLLLWASFTCEINDCKILSTHIRTMCYYSIWSIISNECLQEDHRRSVRSYRLTKDSRSLMWFWSKLNEVSCVFDIQAPPGVHFCICCTDGS